MEKKIFDLWHLPTKHQLADLNTKSVSEKTFRSLSPRIRGLICENYKMWGEPFVEYLRRIKKKRKNWPDSIKNPETLRRNVKVN